jgi:ADP-ribosylation factor GTPase-activating protein 2/3
VINAAQDFAQKFMGQAAEDLESLRTVVQQGSSKLGDFLQDIQNRYG